MRQLTFLFFLVSLCVSANPFTVYTSNSGLIHSNVHCVEQGEKYIWIGTNAGINRISIGVQSFVDKDLRLLGRRHSAKEALSAVEIGTNEGEGAIPWGTVPGIASKAFWIYTHDGYMN